MPKSVFTDAYASVIACLLRLRKRQGISQVELARRLGKPQQFISYVEKGERRIDVVEFYAFAKALDADPVALYAEAVRDFAERVEI